MQGSIVKVSFKVNLKGTGPKFDDMYKLNVKVLDSESRSLNQDGPGNNLDEQRLQDIDEW